MVTTSCLSQTPSSFLQVCSLRCEMRLSCSPNDVAGRAICKEIAVKTRTAPNPSRFLLLMALAAGVALSLAGCNTISGAGQDVANTGHAVSHAANSVENHL